MSAITKLAKRRGRLPALITALALAALFVVQEFLGTVVRYVTAQGLSAARPSDGLFELETTFPIGVPVESLLRYALPFLIGVFVSLWLFAPISDELNLRFAATRAGLASAVGALLVIAVNFVLALVVAVTAPAASLSNAVPMPGFNGAQFATDAVLALSSGVNAFILNTPVVIFGGVLLWLWLRDHPREYAVVGLIDEV